MNEKIAIIIVNYNGYLDTIDCLNSIIQSTYTNFSIYITDNASNDNSVTEIKKYINASHCDIRLIQSEENVGFSGGNNLALEEAIKDSQNSYFLFLNNDTIITPQCISYLISSLSEADCSIGKILYESEKDKIWYAGGNINSKILKPNHRGFNESSDSYNKQSFVTFGTGCCMCVTRECINTVGFWEESYFLYEEDVDLSLRIRQAGMRILYNPQAVLYHKVGSSTGKVSGLSEFYQIRNRLWIIKRYLKPIQRPYAYLYNILTFINRIKKKEYTWIPLLKGIKAYMKGEVGKHEGFVD